jgi:hypothetical protein
MAVSMMDKRMFLPGGLRRMDEIVAPAKECFMMFVCMSIEGNLYCTNCFKTNVVLMCATETLFDDVFKFEYLSTQQSPKKGLCARKNKNDLLKFVDNFCSLKKC